MVETHGTPANDYIYGSPGDDTLFGEGGDDSFKPYQGADLVNGGAGTDLVNYIDSAAAIDIDLRRTTQLGGDAAGDTLVSVESIWGTRFDDHIVGTASGDIVHSDAGDDTIVGGGGFDRLNAGAGDDRVEVSSVGLYQGGDGFDTLAVDATDLNAGVPDGAGFSVIAADGGLGLSDNGIWNTSYEQLALGFERLEFDGSEHNDRVNSLGGDDVVHGGGGDDLIATSTGDDFVDGGSGNDTISLDPFDTNDPAGDWGDAALGGDGDDLISSRLQFDHIDGGAGDDTVALYVSDAEGSVTIDVRPWGDVGSRITNVEHFEVHGATGDDTIFGGTGADTLFGEDGDDLLRGSTGNDTLLGGKGEDVLDGGAGADVLDGGLGFDLADYGGSTAGIDVNLTRATQSGGYAAGDTLSNIEAVWGSPYRDTIIGDAGYNVIHGGDGADLLAGGGGFDRLNGGAGNDYFLMNINDTDEIDGGTGIDTIALSANMRGTYTIDMQVGTISTGATLENVEKLSLTTPDNTGRLMNYTIVGGDSGDQVLLYPSLGTLKFYGGTGNDEVTAGAGNDTISGGGGDDSLRGNFGNDTVTGGSGADMFVFIGSTDQGFDTITDFNAADGDTLNFLSVDYSAISSYGDFLAHATDTAAGVQVDFGDGAGILLAGVTLDEIGAEQVTFF